MKKLLFYFLFFSFSNVSGQIKTSNELIESGDSKLKNKDFESAILDFEDAYALDTNNKSTCLLKIADAKIHLFDYSGALVDLNAVNDENKNLHYFFQLCFVLFELEYYDECINETTNIIKYEPDIPYFYSLRGQSKIKINKNSSAILDFNKLLELNKNYIDGYFYRAVAYYNIKDYTKTVLNCNKLIELKNNHEGAYYFRGLAKRELKDLQGSILNFNKVIELDGDNYGNAHYNRGLCKEELEDFRGAIQDYTVFAELYPTSEKVFYSRGMVKLVLRDNEGGLEDLNKVIEINNQNSEAYFVRGIVKMNLDDLDGACLDFSKAGELGNSKAYDWIIKNCN